MLLCAAAALGAAAAVGPVLGLAAVAAAGGAAALLQAGGLIRLALRIHHERRSFGPCRGAGFLGLGALLAGAGVAVTGLPWLDPGPVAAVTTLVAAPVYLAGLLLLPGTAPDLGARLRRLLDGAGIGVSLFYCAWVLALGHSAPGTAPARLAVALTGCVAVAVAVVTGMRAVRHRPAALACAGVRRCRSWASTCTRCCCSATSAPGRRRRARSPRGSPWRGWRWSPDRSSWRRGRGAPTTSRPGRTPPTRAGRSPRTRCSSGRRCSPSRCRRCT
ncbi:hypothetical protein [Dactylosporangium darangshiense]|uniref:hypothetical protein n=1 Tax=Dactylosporangium darangshiense TaxID=579108 RepID=UPI003626C470